MIGGQAGFAGHLELADRTSVAAQAGVSKSFLEPGTALRGFGHAHRLKGAPASIAQRKVNRTSAFVPRLARIRSALKNVYGVAPLGEKGGPKASYKPRSDDGGVL